MQRNHPSSSSSLSSSPSSSLVVETQTVQSQFVLLTRARDGFRQEMEVCERERRRHEAAVATLRQVGLRLQQDITKAHAVLGTNTKKKQLLTAESQRLQTQLRQERAMLQDCQNQLQSLLDRCTKEKQGFCQEMDRLNQDTQQVLQQREGRHWCQLLLAPNAIPHLTAFGQSKGLEPLAPACIAMWEEALQQHNRCETLHGQLTTELQSWRERAQSTQPQNEARIDWAELESIWRRSKGTPAPQDGFVYGDQEEEAVVPMATDDDNDKDTTRKMNHTERPQDGMDAMEKQQQ